MPCMKKYFDFHSIFQPNLIVRVYKKEKRRKKHINTTVLFHFDKVFFSCALAKVKGRNIFSFYYF